MAQEGRIALKSYFETGDTPTEAQFANKIDSAFNLVDDDSDDIIEGSAKQFVTPAQKSKIDSLSNVGAGTFDTGALTADIEAVINHALDLNVDTVILVARDDADTKDVQVKGLRNIDSDNVGVISLVNLSNLKIKIFGITN